MPTPLRILTVAEYNALEQARQQGLRGGSTKRSDYFEPGMAYYATWYHDPLNWRDLNQRGYTMKMDRERGLAGQTFLSMFYWRDWSDKRPPLIAFCPNMQEWCLDQKANNGPGWQIFEQDGKLTATPSIVVPGYHGWLRDGVFSDDIEGRGPNGV